MTKSSGLVMGLGIDGYDLSGDVGIIDHITGGWATSDVTGMDKSAPERVPSIQVANTMWTSFWNSAPTTGGPAVLNSLTGSDHNVLIYGPALAAALAVGDPAAFMVGRSADWTASRSAANQLTGKFQIEGSAGYGVNWGQLLTTGKQTFANAAGGAGTGLDYGHAWAPTVAITSSSAANPTHIVTAAPHLLVTGDTVYITGHSGSTPAISGNYAVTYVNATEFTIPVNVTVGGTGGTMTRTSSHDGGAAMLQLYSIGSNSVVVAVQDSMDGSSWTDVTNLVFTSASGQTSQRLSIGAGTIIREYVRVNLTGTFTSALIAVALCRYLSTQA